MRHRPLIFLMKSNFILDAYLLQMLLSVRGIEKYFNYSIPSLGLIIHYTYAWRFVTM